jgi:predicted outer membrane lipoprotein
MINKRYWLRGLVIGLVFGILVAYAHEHVREFGHIFGINYDGVNAPLFFGWYLGFIQLLYSFSFYPFFFLGWIGIIFFQYYLPSVTYGILGALFGWAYGKFRNLVK